MKKFLLKPRTVVGLVISIAILVLYAITMAPDVLAHDSGEWQAAGSTFGISHFPGSPAYTLLSNLFALAPIGEPAARGWLLRLSDHVSCQDVPRPGTPEISAGDLYWRRILHCDTSL